MNTFDSPFTFFLHFLANLSSLRGILNIRIVLVRDDSPSRPKNVELLVFVDNPDAGDILKQSRSKHTESVPWFAAVRLGAGVTKLPFASVNLVSNKNSFE